MKDKKILFITFDLSGYYDNISKGLAAHFSDVEFHNIADIKLSIKLFFNAFIPVYTN